MVDARGYSCPIPVLMVKKALDEGNDPAVLEVLLDEDCAVGNVTRLAQNRGYQVSVEELGSEFKLQLKK